VNYEEAVESIPMPLDGWITIGVIIGVFVALVRTGQSPDVIFLGGLALLLLTGILEPTEALQGFSSESLVTIALLYVVVAGLQDTGAVQWMADRILGKGIHPFWIRFRLLLPVSVSSGFLNNTPIVAMFLPMVLDWCRKVGAHPARFLLPLSYASILGGFCTLIGTSTNLVVHGLMKESGSGMEMGLFDLAPVGVPCALVGLVYLLLVSGRLPSRQGVDSLLDESREYTLELRVEMGGVLDGVSIQKAGLRQLRSGFLVDLVRAGRVISAVSPEEILEGGDQLVFVGQLDGMRDLYGMRGLESVEEGADSLHQPRHRRILVEAVVSKVCPLVGMSIRDGQFRRRYNAVVIAVARNGARIDGKVGDIVLRPGDTLLVESHAGFLARQRDSRDFHLVSRVEDSSPKRYERGGIALGILGLMVGLAATSTLSLFLSVTLAVVLMLATGCVRPTRARRSVEWNVILTIAAALGLGQAMDKSGAAAWMAEGILGIIGESPTLALAVIYVCTLVLTELITNNGAAVLVFPVALDTAERLSVHPMPFMVVLMIAASASFITPIGYQTNLMVYGPGGYRFSDYLRLGVPLSLLVALGCLLITPSVFPFHP
jgi:di/tricarboxylate transporter